MVEELKVEHDVLRKLATHVLGTMLSDRGSTVDRQYPTVWSTWILKRNDKLLDIRLEWLEFAQMIMMNHPDKAAELCSYLEEKLFDPEERVRARVIECLSALMEQVEVAPLEAISTSFLTQVGSRTKDKKFDVRRRAIYALAKLFNAVYADLCVLHYHHRHHDTSVGLVVTLLRSSDTTGFPAIF
jgi:sister-chromatid-cohesion protein PDS5